MAKKSTSIRMPFHRHFRDVRYRLVPMLVFLLCILAVVRIWPRSVVPLQPADPVTDVRQPPGGSEPDRINREGEARRPSEDVRRPSGFGRKFQVRLEDRKRE